MKRDGVVFRRASQHRPVGTRAGDDSGSGPLGRTREPTRSSQQRVRHSALARGSTEPTNTPLSLSSHLSPEASPSPLRLPSHHVQATLVDGRVDSEGGSARVERGRRPTRPVERPRQPAARLLTVQLAKRVSVADDVGRSSERRHDRPRDRAPDSSRCRMRRRPRAAARAPIPISGTRGCRFRCRFREAARLLLRSDGLVDGESALRHASPPVGSSAGTGTSFVPPRRCRAEAKAVEPKGRGDETPRARPRRLSDIGAALRRCPCPHGRVRPPCSLAHEPLGGRGRPAGDRPSRRASPLATRAAARAARPAAGLSDNVNGTDAPAATCAAFVMVAAYGELLRLPARAPRRAAFAALARRARAAKLPTSPAMAECERDHDRLRRRSA